MMPQGIADDLVLLRILIPCIYGTLRVLSLHSCDRQLKPGAIQRFEFLDHGILDAPVESSY